MNKTRREALQKVYDLIADARDTLEMLRDEEDEYRENMPENLQESIRYEAASEAVDNMDSAISSIEDALDYIEEAQA